MSVVGIIILVTLLLILKLITQMAVVAEPVSAPAITETELNEQIESLENVRRDIRDEIAKLNPAAENPAPLIPLRDQIDALRTSITRIEGDVEKIEEAIKTAKERHEEMTNRPDAQLAMETEKSIQELQRLQDELKREIHEQAKQQHEFQAKQDDLNQQMTELERRLSQEVTHHIYAIPSKTTDKTPYLLIYGQGTITVLSQADPKGQSFTSRQAFFSWVSGRNKKTEYLVLYVRPSRFDEYENILDPLKKMGFDVGLQVLGEKTEIFLHSTESTAVDSP